MFQYGTDRAIGSVARMDAMDRAENMLVVAASHRMGVAGKARDGEGRGRSGD